MCGRFVSSNSPSEIAAYFGASVGEAIDDAPLSVSYNVAPTNDVYGVVDDADCHPVVRSFRWGLVPVWAKDLKIGSKMINARGETLGEKPAFKGLFRKHRLIIPMTGFYEWKVVAGQKAKQPMFIQRADGQPLAVAGLWSAWRDKADGSDAPWLHTCTVITTSANATMAPIHDRMPVLLTSDRWAEWLDPTNNDTDALAALLVPAPDDVLVMHPVSSAVNTVRNKGAELILPDEPSAPTLDL